MSVESEILRIQRNVADTYAMVAEKGGTVPLQPNSENLPAAVSSIPAGGSGGGGVPKGSIIIWSGSISDIPDGWALCDGQSGRPDLRNRFVLGAGTRAVGSTGGSEEVTLSSSQMPSHSHSITISSNAPNLGVAYIGRVNGGEVSYRSEYTGKEGQNAPHPNMPPYYVLCYIIKI